MPIDSPAPYPSTTQPRLAETMHRILVIGGFGAVGRETAASLRRLLPHAEVIAAGRNPTPQLVPDATAMRLDASDDGAVAAVLDGVDTVIMCAELDNARVARACLSRGISYLDVSASAQQLGRLEALDSMARDHGTTAVLSVGLAPGVTNILARHCADRSASEEVTIGVLLGSGEQHGRAALRWTLAGLGELDGSWTMRFPSPYGHRTIHRFPFSDQFTLPRTLQVEQVTTGLCLQSRGLTTLLGAARHPTVSRLIHHTKVIDTLLAILSRVHLGGDGFAVTALAGGARASLSGRRQTHATALVAALVAARLPSMPPGVRHIEQVVDPAELLAELRSHGFDLELGS